VIWLANPRLLKSAQETTQPANHGLTVIYITHRGPCHVILMSMTKGFRQRYFAVTAAAIVIGIGFGLQLAGKSQWTATLLILFCLALSTKIAWDIMQTFRQGKWGVDLLALAAILATLAVGEYWAASIIVLMFTGGEALEDYANRRAQRELGALMARAPSVAHRVSASGLEEDIAIGNITIGDRLLVWPGEVVPVDGTLLSGTGTFDESSLTGESLPVEHRQGEQVLSGSVNNESPVTIQALRTAQDSQYQQIIALVQAASNSQAPFVRLADRYAVPFTVLSFAIAGLGWLVSRDPVRFAQVLVVATPCPLLLGAPIAFISGMSRAAKNGIIIKNGGTLEKLANLKTVAFDKTGTLTQGQISIAQIKPALGTSQRQLLRIAASAEQHSTHLLAKSLLAAAKAKHIRLYPAARVTETTAQGISALVAGRNILVGKAAFLRDKDISVSNSNLATGHTALYVAQGSKYLGSILFTDTVRTDSRQTLANLSALGIRHTLMVTGDATATAQRIGKMLGISEIHAECLPKDKVAIIQAVTERPLMMVGDGVNDAPVLAAADVGLAMGARGSTAASETADVVILLDDITRCVLAVHIGRDTMRIALQSIWLGIAASIVLMLIATTGLIPAAVGAGLQEIVDVFVILNALRAHR